MTNFTPYLSARSATPAVAASNVSQSADIQTSADNTGKAHARALPGVNLPSRASNAANAVIPLGVIQEAASILSAYIVPTASQAGSATNFANVAIIDLSTDGTGTVVLASKTFSATGTSVAAFGVGSMALATALTVASGHAIGVSYTSQGNGIALVAHSIHVAYRYS